MSELKITIPADESHPKASLFVEDENEILTIEINDIFYDNAVISLPEPQRTEFINKIKELNND